MFRLYGEIDARVFYQRLIFTDI